MKGRYFNALILALVMSFGFTSLVYAQASFRTDILKQTFGYGRATQKAVKLTDLAQGCAVRDCIPSIDNPRYVTAREASHVSDDEPVLAMSWKSYHRAWPTRIMDSHEIVNDFIAGDAIAITWCPLCGSAVAVNREIEGRIVEFGVSGLLYNSDLVFYDRATETLWDQIEAKGIVGPLTGTQLELIPVTLTRWGQWKEAHPDTLVLSEDTGFNIDYNEDPYRKYRDSRRLMFKVSNRDSRIHPKSVVFGFVVDESKVAITEESLEIEPEQVRMIAGRAYRISLTSDGSVSMSDQDGGKAYFPTRLFWFAWYTFHPETALFE